MNSYGSRKNLRPALNKKERKPSITSFEENLCKKFLSNEFTCSICLEIMKKPTIIKCKHTFCEECINIWSSRNMTHMSYSCPMCRETIIDKPIKLPVIEEIIELLTSCTNKKSKVQNLVGDPQFLHDSRRHTSGTLIRPYSNHIFRPYPRQSSHESTQAATRISSLPTNIRPTLNERPPWR